jgi:hypothetical protein
MLFHVCCSEPNTGVALIAGDGWPIYALQRPIPQMAAAVKAPLRARDFRFLLPARFVVGEYRCK